MPAKNYNEYMNNYMKKRYLDRRENAINFLGGECIRCGSKNNLQFDHVDPKNKKFAIAKSSGKSNKDFWEEIEKCQILCDKCHREKTLGEGSLNDRDIDKICNCGRVFKTKNAYAGHKTWCKL